MQDMTNVIPALRADPRTLVPYYYNPALDSDSYKLSHWLQYRPGVRTVYSYVESRGGRYDDMLFFGLQHLIIKYMTQPITSEQVDEANEFAKKHGTPFNHEGWKSLQTKHGRLGRWPVRIRAVKEGTILPVRHAVVDIENTDHEFPWLTSYLETKIVRAVWFPTTVASRDLKIYRVIKAALLATGDESSLAGLPFKLNDFGARGVSSYESSEIGGMAHLVLFKGTDNLPAVQAARFFYGEDMAGFSIPAAEHSTMTSWGGRDGELAAMRNMVERFAKPGAIVACVSDSYDLWNAVSNYWGGRLHEMVRDSGAVVVVRPDSGDARVVPAKAIRMLMDRVGSKKTAKGYDMLPDYYRMIQGDGIDEDSVPDILENMRRDGIAADNIAFGMGGGMLQQLNRDTMRFAMKCSAIQEHDGSWTEVYKEPITDGGKTSKRGRQELMYDGETGKYTTTNRPMAWGDKLTSALRTVYEDGQVSGIETLSEIRSRALARA